MNTVALPGGRLLPALGLGTWRMGEAPGTREKETAAVVSALESGYRLIDTAEMYGEGGAERVVGAAVAEAVGRGVVRREDLVLVSKVYPHNATARGVIEACARSLDRLGTRYIDLYLLHWRGQHPLASTVEGFETLKGDGRIRDWGVSNFDVEDMDELWHVDGGRACAINQVYYSATERGIEFDLLPWQRRHHVPLMAYCPVDQGAAATNPVLAAVAAARGVTAAQVALAWILRHPDVIAIPKAIRANHQRENLAAAGLALTPGDLARIDAALPPPTRKRPLAMT